MTHNNRDADFSVVVFPFLKTSEPVQLGGMTFRSTDDVEGLTQAQATAVRDVAQMLFLRDDYRVKSATYAVVPRIDTDVRPPLDTLVRVQAVVAYCYAGPRHEFGDIFLSPEHASLVVLTPGSVVAGLVHPDHHVERVGDRPADEGRGAIDGFSGIYNFRHHFWAARGSRLYGPLPQMTLNMSQDLCTDLEQARTGRADDRRLLELLHHPDGAVATRVFSAVRWFNSANSEWRDEAAELVDLSIAFETLLQLPREEKTSRLADAVSLLLGRTPRLDSWVQQFYDARSRVAHEGRADQLRFVVTTNGSKAKGASYQTLISYGRLVFQLCVGTILAGARLAERARLEEMFITNQERFEQTCKVLGEATLGPAERLHRVSALVAAIQDYRYVPDSGLRGETMLGACRKAARCWIDSDPELPAPARDALERLANAPRGDDTFASMEALAAVDELIRSNGLRAESDGARTARDLLEAVWMYVFQHYFWLKERRPPEGGTQPPAAAS